MKDVKVKVNVRTRKVDRVSYDRVLLAGSTSSAWLRSIYISRIIDNLEYFSLPQLVPLPGHSMLGTE